MISLGMIHSDPPKLLQKAEELGTEVTSDIIWLTPEHSQCKTKRDQLLNPTTLNLAQG